MSKTLQYIKALTNLQSKLAIATYSTETLHMIANTIESYNDEVIFQVSIFSAENGKLFYNVFPFIIELAVTELRSLHPRGRETLGKPPLFIMGCLACSILAIPLQPYNRVPSITKANRDSYMQYINRWRLYMLDETDIYATFYKSYIDTNELPTSPFVDIDSDDDEDKGEEEPTTKRNEKGVKVGRPFTPDVNRIECLKEDDAAFVDRIMLVVVDVYKDTMKRYMLGDPLLTISRRNLFDYPHWEQIHTNLKTALVDGVFSKLRMNDLSRYHLDLKLRKLLNEAFRNLTQKNSENFKLIVQEFFKPFKRAVAEYHKQVETYLSAHPAGVETSVLKTAEYDMREYVISQFVHSIRLIRNTEPTDNYADSLKCEMDYYVSVLADGNNANLIESGLGRIEEFYDTQMKESIADNIYTRASLSDYHSHLVSVLSSELTAYTKGWLSKTDPTSSATVEDPPYFQRLIDSLNKRFEAHQDNYESALESRLQSIMASIQTAIVYYVSDVYGGADNVKSADLEYNQKENKCTASLINVLDSMTPPEFYTNHLRRFQLNIPNL
jgi:hypothetical protein